MTKSIIGHNFLVSQVDYSVDTRCRLNINKRHSQVVYRTATSRDNVNIAYVEGPNSNVIDNLFISDRSTSLIQNRIVGNTVREETTGSFVSTTDKLVITNIYTTETPTQPATPLFYVHTFKNFNPENDDWSQKTLINVRFTDHNFIPITISEYFLDSSLGRLYNNLENTFTLSTNLSTVYFIQYTVKITSGSTSNIITYHELLNNYPVFNQAEADDLDEWGNLIPTVQAYLIEDSIYGDGYLITLPATTDYAWKELKDSRLKLIRPDYSSLSQPWYIKIQNGSIVASIQTDLNTWSNYKYYIPEFTTQSFSPYYPYKLIYNQEATWISKNIIKVPYGVVVNSSLSLHIEILVRDNTGVLTAIYTTDTSKENTIYQGNISYVLGIASYDHNTGFIELTEEIDEEATITVNYFIEETQYEFVFVNLNPTNNLDILTQRVAIYVAPETIATGELEYSTHYLLIDTLGRITYCSQATSGAADPATQKLTLEDFFIDGSPRHEFYYDIESTASGLMSTASGFYSQFVDEFSFIDKYTLESVLLNQVSTDSGLLTGSLYSNFINNPRFLVLGDMSVGESISPNKLTTYDVRIQGGGIKDDEVEEVLLIQPEVSWYWDIAKEIPYPAGGTFYVEVPKNLYTEYGGAWTNEQIRAVIEKYSSAGSYAVIRPYGIDPVITNTIIGSGLMTFDWPSYGAGQTYNVYFSTDNKDFVLSSGSPYTDVGSANSLTISGLKLGTRYYVYVAGINDDGYDEAGPVVAITTGYN